MNDKIKTILNTCIENENINFNHLGKNDFELLYNEKELIKIKNIDFLILIEKEKNNRIKEIKQLEESLKASKEFYYNKEEDSGFFADLNNDETYDQLEERLLLIDPDNELFKTIGSSNETEKIISKEKTSCFPEKEHTLKMGSQNKVQDMPSYNKWLQLNNLENEEFCISNKADGSSLAITYSNNLEDVKTNYNYVYNYMKQYFSEQEKLDILENSKKELFSNIQDNKFNLLAAASRKDGIVGEDITYNAKNFKGLISAIDINNLFKDENLNIDGTSFNKNEIKRIEVRGEVVVKKSDFKILNKNGKYKNERNSAAGIMRRQNAEGTDFLSLIAYDLILVDENDNEIEFNDTTKFELLKKMGFEVTDYFIVKNFKEIEKLYTEYKSKLRNKVDYLIDGLVAKINNVEKRKSLGITNQRPNGEKAIKFEHQIKMATFSHIHESFGVSGIVTPVGVFEPIDIDGVTVENASLSNKERMELMLLTPGDKIMVSRRNDVIPKIEENIKLQNYYKDIYTIISKYISKMPNDSQEKLNNNIEHNNHEFKLELNRLIIDMKKNNKDKKYIVQELDKRILNNVIKEEDPLYKETLDLFSLPEQELLSYTENNVEFPEYCPKCGSPLYKEDSSYKCLNNDCPGVKVGKLVSFTEQVDGMGEGKITQLFDFKVISDIKDLMSLTSNDFIDKNSNKKEYLFGWNKKSVDKFLQGVDSLKNLTDSQFFGNLKFNKMGESRFIKLFQNLDYEELLNTDKEILKEKIKTLEGFADGISTILVEELDKRKPEVEELLNHINLNKTPKLDKNKKLYTFVVTGSIKGYSDKWKDRKELEKYLKNEGNTVSGSVSSKTSYLINNDINSTSGKNAEAKKLGVNIINEEQLISILFGNDLNQEETIQLN